jgi:VanZ family protein
MLNYKALKHQRLSIGWSIVVLVLCNMKISSGANSGFFFEGFDKMVHLGLFYILTILSIFGSIRYRQSYRLPILTIIKLLTFSLILGGGIEILQWKVFTYRSAEWWDFVCDLTGSTMAIVTYILWHANEYTNEKI